MILSVSSYSSYSIFPQDGDTVLTRAVRKCGAEVVVELVKAGAYVNLPNHVCHCIIMHIMQVSSPFHLCMSFVIVHNHVCPHTGWNICSDDSCQVW